jgi:hypothetical protein
MTASMRRRVPTPHVLAILAGCWLSACGGAVAAAQETAGAFPVPRIFAPGVISGPMDDASPAFAPDGSHVFFMRGGKDGGWTLMQSQRTGSAWSMPRPAPFSGHWRDLDPAMAPDGSFLLFVSNRPATPGGKRLDAVDPRSGKVYPGFGMNIWRVEHEGDGWGVPVRLPDAINNGTSTFAPSVAADGSMYYMARDKAGTIRLYRAAYRDGHYQAPVRVPLGSDDATIRDAAVAPDESFIVFSITTDRKRHPLRLAIAFRDKYGGWSHPLDLGPTVNDAGYAMGSQLGADHHTLYFYSQRAGTTHASPAPAWDNGGDNIWTVDLSPWLRRHRSAASR